MSMSLLQLWLPIILGAIAGWIASGLIHAVIKTHNSDYRQLENEDEVMDAVRKGSPAPGMYHFPFCVDMEQIKDEAMQQKLINGPIGLLAIFPNGLPNMGKYMVQQIAFFLVGCFLIAYCATLAIPPGAEYLTVFRFVASVGFLAFGWALIPYSIWFGHPWSMTAKYLVDALIYGLIIAGIFAWLWPEAGA